MSIDSTIQVQPDSVGAGTGSGVTAGKLVKTVQTLDSLQNKIDIQCVCITDERGNVIIPLSEATGQAILAALIQHSSLLARQTGALI